MNVRSTLGIVADLARIALMIAGILAVIVGILASP